MLTVGAFEAKTHFARLLQRVSRGEQVVITRHGTPVARLIPATGTDRERVRETIDRLKTFARGQTLNGLSVRELRDAGRR